MLLCANMLAMLRALSATKTLQVNVALSY